MLSPILSKAGRYALRYGSLDRVGYMAAAGRAMKFSTEEKACGSMNYLEWENLAAVHIYRCRIAKALSEKPDFKNGP